MPGGLVASLSFHARKQESQSKLASKTSHIFKLNLSLTERPCQRIPDIICLTDITLHMCCKHSPTHMSSHTGKNHGYYIANVNMKKEKYKITFNMTNISQGAQET